MSREELLALVLQLKRKLTELEARVQELRTEVVREVVTTNEWDGALSESEGR